MRGGVFLLARPNLLGELGLRARCLFGSVMVRCLPIALVSVS
jgi:hypothetical protein